MTVFEYIIENLPRKFEAFINVENDSILRLELENMVITIEDRGQYFVVSRQHEDRLNIMIYTETSNKHELLGLLVELTK